MSLLIERIDAEIFAAEERLNALRSVRKGIELLGEDFFLRATGDADSVKMLIENRSEPVQESSESNAAKIVRFFEDRDNRWAETSEIIKVTGISRGIVGNVLYVSGKNSFESSEHPEQKRRRLWRLRREPEANEEVAKLAN